MFDIHQLDCVEDGERDSAEVEKYIEDLLTEFRGSLEAKPLLEKYGAVHWSGVMMHYSIGYEGVTPAEMSVSNFEEVLYGIFPRKVVVDPEGAGEIVAGLHAFWKFLDRQYGLENAREIYESISETTVNELEQALGDSSTFGPAKSFFRLGQEAGLDMTTAEGISAFQAIYNANLAEVRSGMPRRDQNPTPGRPSSIIPPFGRPHGEALKQIRDAKKRQRAAKKKNRR